VNRIGTSGARVFVFVEDFVYLGFVVNELAYLKAFIYYD